MDLEKRKHPVIPKWDPSDPIPLISWKDNDTITTSGEYQYKPLLQNIPEDASSITFSVTGTGGHASFFPNDIVSPNFLCNVCFLSKN